MEITIHWNGRKWSRITGSCPGQWIYKREHGGEDAEAQRHLSARRNPYSWPCPAVGSPLSAAAASPVAQPPPDPLTHAAGVGSACPAPVHTRSASSGGPAVPHAPHPAVSLTPLCHPVGGSAPVTWPQEWDLPDDPHSAVPWRALLSASLQTHFLWAPTVAATQITASCTREHSNVWFSFTHCVLLLPRG